MDYQPNRGSSGVPGPDAFDKVNRRPPPDLPGYEQERAEYLARRQAQQQARQQPPGRKPGQGNPAQGAAKRSNNGQRSSRPGDEAQAPPRRPKQAPGAEEAKKPEQKPVDPAKLRRNRRIAAVAALLVLIAAGTFFSVRVLFKIDTFTIEGECPYTLEEVVAAFGHSAGENMFGFSAAAAQTRIEQGLPYIESVDIRRRLPGTVVFRVQPAVERYSLNQDGQIAVLSAGRKVLRLADAEPEGLTRLEGLTGLSLVPGFGLTVSEGAPAPTTPVPSTPAQTDDAAQPVDPAQPAGDGDPAADPADPAQDGAAANDIQETTPPEGGGEGGDSPAEGTPEEGAPAEGTPEEGTPAEGEGGDPAPASTPPADGATALTAPTAQNKLEALNLLLDTLDQAQFPDVSWVNVADPLDLRFCYQNRITVRLGAKGSLPKKVEFAKVLLTDPAKSQITEGDRGVLDVSAYPDLDRVWMTPG